MAKDVSLTAVLKLRDEFSQQANKIQESIKKLEAELKQAGHAGKPLSGALDRIKEQFAELEKHAHDSFHHAADAGKHSAEVVRDAWIKTVAKVTAAAYAIREGFDLAQETAKAEQAMQAFALTVQAKGKDVEKVFEELKEKSGGLVSNKDLVQAANSAIALGIPIEKMGKLMEIARYRARLFGEDVSQAFMDIATGIGRMSPMILDNLGIVVKLSDAYEAYAKAHGKTVDQLTAEEQKTALLNAVMKQSEGVVKNFSRTGETAAEKFQRMNATLENMKEELGVQLIPLYTQLVEIFIKLVPWIEKSLYGLKMLWATLKAGFEEVYILWLWAQSKFSSSWEDISAMIEHAYKKNKKLWRQQIKELKEEMENSKIGEIDWEELMHLKGKHINIPVRPEVQKPAIGADALDALKKIQEAMEDATAPDIEKQKRQWDKWKEQQLQLAKSAGLNTALLQIELENIVQQKKAEIDRKYQEQRIQDEVNTQSRLADMMLSFMQSQLDFARRNGQISAFDYLTQKVEVLKERIKVLKWQMAHAVDATQAEMLAEQIERINNQLVTTNEELKRLGRTAGEALKDGLKRALHEIKPLTDQLEDLMVRTSQSMEQAFSDFFFDAMRGKLKSLDDYFRSFAQSVMRYIADIMAKMVALQLLQGVTKTMGIPLPKIHTGGEIVPGGVRRFHNGGPVLRSDEVPAILQVGEVVLSRNQVAAMANSRPNVTINVKNETGVPMQFDVVGMRKQREAEIIDVVVKHAQLDPSFRAILGG